MKKFIHVNQHTIKANRKNGTRKCPITVKTYKSNDYGCEIDAGVFKVVYRPENPLACGAEVWIETDLDLKVIKRRKLHA